MNTVLLALLVAAVVVAVAVSWFLYRARRVGRTARDELARQRASLEATAQASDAAEQRAGAAERRVHEAEARAAEADRRAEQAGLRVDEVERRAHAAEAALASAEERSAASAASAWAERDRALDRARVAEEALISAEERLAAATSAGRERDQALARARSAEAELVAVQSELAAAGDRLMAIEAQVAAASRGPAPGQRPARPVGGGGGTDTAGAAWELERLRVEREWADVVGPGVALPAPWDGTLAAVVATELAVIREVMGTPSQVEVTGPVAIADPGAAVAASRAAVELIRTLARSGLEMVVSVSGGKVTVGQPAEGAEPPAEVQQVAAAMDAAGIPTSVAVEGGRLLATIDLPG